MRNPRLPLLPGYGSNTLVSNLLHFSYIKERTNEKEWCKEDKTRHPSYERTYIAINLCSKTCCFLQIGKKSFGVRPIFTSVDKVNMLVDKAADTNRVPSFYCRKQAPEQPTWLMYDKNVCLLYIFLILITYIIASIFWVVTTCKLKPDQKCNPQYIAEIALNSFRTLKTVEITESIQTFKAYYVIFMFFLRLYKIFLHLQILRFQGFYQETLHEMRSATRVLHKLDIFFYLEDGTIKVIEPRTDNSGFSQGLILKHFWTYTQSSFPVRLHLH